MILWLSACGPVLPGVCAGDSAAERVVDRFWGRLEQDYAVFEERLGPDSGEQWATLGTEACAAVVADDGDEVVIEELTRLARALDDGHVQLELGDRFADGWTTPWPHLDRMMEVPERLGLTRRGREGLAFGRVGTVGVLWAARFDALSWTGTEAADRRVLQRVLEEADPVWDGADGLVIDVRANEGGWDDVGLALAGWLAGPAAEVVTVAQRDGPGHRDLGEPQAVHLPSSEGFDGRVVVLTSGGTFSAGEVFVLAARERPNVTVLGERTSGHLSDLYADRLPRRGWTFTYSGDRYAPLTGEVYEGAGIPPDVVRRFDAERFDAGEDVSWASAVQELTAAE